jgi:hypothetical protein
VRQFASTTTIPGCPEPVKAIFAADDDLADLERTGLILAQKYLLEAPPEIQPAAVELAVTGEVGGVAVRGYVDLLDVNGCVLDLRTASKKPSGLRASQKLQLTTYTLITPRASGQCRIDSLIKTKTPQCVQQKYPVSKADVRFAETMLASVQAAAGVQFYSARRAAITKQLGPAFGPSDLLSYRSTQSGSFSP